jgi:hypothetical protein
MIEAAKSTRKIVSATLFIVDAAPWQAERIQLTQFMLRRQDL